MVPVPGVTNTYFTTNGTVNFPTAQCLSGKMAIFNNNSLAYSVLTKGVKITVADPDPVFWGHPDPDTLSTNRPICIVYVLCTVQYMYNA